MTSSPLLPRLLAAIALLQLVAIAQAPLYAPSLLFNWTLRNVDAPLKLRQFLLTNPNDPHSPAVKEGSASAEVEFIGNGIAFKGQGRNWETTQSGLPQKAGGAYVVGDPTWDDANRDMFSPASDSVLWQRSMPRFKEYTTTLLALQGEWTLDSVEIMTGMNSSADSLADVDTKTEYFVTDDGKLNPFFNLTGHWEVVPASDSLPVHAKCMDDAVLRVPIPRGTAYIVVDGTRSSASKDLYFVLEKNGDQNDRETAVIDASFPTATEGLLFMRPLDPNTSYVLVVTCVFVGQYGENGMTSVTFYEGDPHVELDDNEEDYFSQGSRTGGTGGSRTGGTSGSPTGSPSAAATDSSSSSSFGVGAIVGIVVGVVALLAIVLGLWLCIRKRKRTTHAPPAGIPVYQSGAMNGHIDSSPSVQPTPYPVSQPAYQPPVLVHDQPYANSESPPPAYGEHKKV